MDIKKILLKAIKLQAYMEIISDQTNQSKKAVEHFKSVWGEEMTEHLLWKYSSAKSLIESFDEKNLQLFIEKF